MSEIVRLKLKKDLTDSGGVKVPKDILFSGFAVADDHFPGDVLFIVPFQSGRIALERKEVKDVTYV